MFLTSLTTHSTVDPDLFPLLTIRSCISEAEESRNGPRFCGQDKLTGCVYEVRCVKLQLSRPSADLAKPDVAKLKKQQQRIDALMAASASGRCPPSVALPIDVYIQEQTSSGVPYVAAVDTFAGLSLGDIVRSGWRLVEEHVFLEILNAVEQFSCAASSLPPHGNLSADAIRQLLTVRDGAAEAEQRSRWVVGDWLLLHDADNERFDPSGFVGDVEWMLHSAFSQLSIASAADGSFLSRAHVESAIGEAVERIREHLLRGGEDVGQHGPLEPHDPARKLSGMSNEEEYSPTGISSSADVGSAGTATSPPAVPDGPLLSSRRSTSASPPRDVMELARDLSLRDKIAYHQGELRKEQQLANKYRRRNAPLPPLPAPSPALGCKQDYEAAEAAEYEMQYLTSPIHPRPSRLLCEPSPVEVPAARQRAQSAPPTRSSRKRAAAAAAAASAVKPRDSPKTIEYCQPRQQLHGEADDTRTAPINREVLLEQVVSLALLTQTAAQQQAHKKWEEDRMKRESLRLALARSAAVEAHRQQQQQQQAASASAKAASPGRGVAARGPGRSLVPTRAYNNPGKPHPTPVSTTGSFPLHQQQQQQKGTGNRRRVTPQEQPLLTQLHTQSSTLNSGLGTSTLIQVSHSAVPLAEARQQQTGGADREPPPPLPSPRQMPATRTAAATRAPPPVVEPLPLADLLNARNREGQAKQQTKQPAATAGRGAIPPQYSVRGSPRTASGNTPAAAPRQSPRGAYVSAKSPSTGHTPRGQVAATQRSPQRRPHGKQSPRAVPELSPNQVAGGGTPRRGSAGSLTAGGPHSPSAHPHGLARGAAAVRSGSRPKATARAQRHSSQGTSPPPVPQTDSNADTTTAPPPPPPPAAAVVAAPKKSSGKAAVRVESPRVATDTGRTAPQLPVAVESHPISLRSPRLQQQQQQTERANQGKPRGGRALPQSRQRPAKAETPKADGNGKGRNRSLSPVTKRDVHPVHEASIGITHRRKRAGLQDLW